MTDKNNSRFQKTSLSPPRIIIYGGEGIGKSTFAANAPKPVFIQTEDGLSGLDVEAGRRCTSWQDVIDDATWLRDNDHDFKTVVLDSADWADDLCSAHVTEMFHVKNIGDIPYGEGYTVMKKLWRELLDIFDRLRLEKNMVIILTSHSKIKTIDTPLSKPYDKHSLDLTPRIAQLVSEWSDIILFATEKLVVIEKKGEKNKAVSHDHRIILTRGTPAYVAKSRYRIPEEINLDYAEFINHVRQSKGNKS